MSNDTAPASSAAMGTHSLLAPRVACIGVGYWGKNLVRNFEALGALTRICDGSEDVRSRMADSYPDVDVTDDVDGVLGDPDVDAVAIATPAATHADIVARALKRGKHVFVEKPLALSGKDGERLVQLAEERGLTLMVGHVLWYHPAVLKLKELVDSGEIGRLQYIYSNRLNLGKIRREESILWSFAPHDISVILGLVNEEPSSVRAVGANYLHNEIADVTVSHLSFPSGVKAHIFVSWLHPFKEQKLVVVGDRKMAVFNDTAPGNKLLLYPHNIDWKNGIPVATKSDGEPVEYDDVEPLRAECSHFLGCVRTGDRPRTDGKEALSVLSVLTACEEDLRREAAPRRRESERPPARAGHPGVHESSYVDEDVQIGEGTRIWHFSHVLSGSRIGRGCSIGQNVVIGPDVVIGDKVKIQNNVSVYKGVTLEDHVFCGPSMVFTNVYNPRSTIRRMDELRPTLVKEGASLGANCTVVCGNTIGRFAFVGAGAVVTRDVRDYALVVGNPGRVVGWMCECGNGIRFEEGTETGTCRACGKRYEKRGSEVKALCRP